MTTLVANDIIDQRYQVIRPLGEGAQSCVYLVSDFARPLARWALKQLRLSELPQSEQKPALAMFAREADILRRLHHQALPKLIDYAEPANENPYIVMERVSGHPLDEVLDRRSTPLRLEEALPIALQLTHLLCTLHSQNPPIIYRDLKPSNLILADSGMVRLIDFGIARFRSDRSAKDTQELGTPGYSAPEQYRGNSSPRSDIYSLGVTLYYMLTFKDPQDQNFNFPPLEDVIDVPKELSNIVARCLEVDAEKRPTSALDVQKQLLRVLDSCENRKSHQTQPLEPGLLHLSKHLAMLNS